MLRRVRATYTSRSTKNRPAQTKQSKAQAPKAPRSGPLGKRRRQRLLLGENYNPNNLKDGLKIVTSIKYDTMVHKRQKVDEDDVLASTSTAITTAEKTKRKEFQGNRIYRKQKKGGKANFDIFRKPLKMQKTGRWKYFNLFIEKDLKWSTKISQHLIDNEVDDD